MTQSGSGDACKSKPALNINHSSDKNEPSFTHSANANTCIGRRQNENLLNYIKHLNNECDTGIADNEEKYDGDMTPFDKRPIKDIEFIKSTNEFSAKELAEAAVRHLNKQGFCVFDGLFSKQQIKHAVKDIESCIGSGKLTAGRLEGGRTSGEEEKLVTNANIRSDKILWLEGCEPEVAGIAVIVAKMDEIMANFNQFLGDVYDISGRTKVCL